MPNVPNETIDESAAGDTSPACVLSFNANDPSGACGLSADLCAIASVGAHAMPVMTGAYARDTARIFDFFPLPSEAVEEQATVVLEDCAVHAFKLGFAGTPDTLGVIASLSADYPETPLIAWMPDLSWWTTDQIDSYHDAFSELILPQTAILVGNHSTLWRWLLPTWSSQRPPSARDIAMAAHALGAGMTLVTGMSLADRSIENTLAAPQAVLASEKHAFLEATFIGAGDTLSGAFAALVASGCEPAEALSEAMGYLARCLAGGYRPGMGHVVPDRLFWAQPGEDDDTTAQDSFTTLTSQEPSPHDKQH